MQSEQNLSPTNILELPTLETEPAHHLSQTNPQNPPISGQKRSADKPPADRKPAAKKDANARRIRELSGFYMSVGLLISQFDTYTGVVLMQKAEDRARELVGVAQHHPWLLNAIDRMTKSNDYISLLLGHGIMAYAILAHHGRVPDQPMLLAQFGYGPIPGLEQQPQQEESLADYATAAGLNGHL